jgi:hypothetical protein
MDEQEQVERWMTMPTELTKRCLSATFMRNDYPSVKAGVANLGDDVISDQVVSVQGLRQWLVDDRVARGG